MNTLTRRHSLLASVAILASAGMLTACGGFTTSELAKYSQAAANAAKNILAVVPNPPADLATAVSALAAAADAVQGIGPSTASAAQQVYDAIKVVLRVAAPFVAPIPGAGIAVGAILALMPFIATAAGLVATPAAAVAGAPHMTAAQALKLYGS